MPSPTIRRIHITGASGCGKTTLGHDLAQALKYNHFDIDHYYWLPSDPPYQNIRPLVERQALLENDMNQNRQWISTGSIVSWGNFALKYFDLVIFLYSPTDKRLDRITKREIERHGQDSIQPGSKFYPQYIALIDWAGSYDRWELGKRSLATDNKWLSELPCPILRLEEDITNQERLEIILKFLNIEI